jgi:hypothetical protein
MQRWHDGSEHEAARGCTAVESTDVLNLLGWAGCSALAAMKVDFDIVPSCVCGVFIASVLLTLFTLTSGERRGFASKGELGALPPIVLWAIALVGCHRSSGRRHHDPPVFYFARLNKESRTDAFSSLSCKNQHSIIFVNTQNLSIVGRAYGEHPVCDM